MKLKDITSGHPLVGWARLVLGDPVCSYCNRVVAEPDWRTPDHIHPVSFGGGRINNLTMACPSCNRKKGNQKMLHFLISIGGLK